MGVTGSLNRVEYVNAVPSHTDWIWRVGGRISYTPLRWLNLSLDYYHAENDSDLGTSFSYKENRVFASITVFYGLPGQRVPTYFPTSTRGPQLIPPWERPVIPQYIEPSPSLAPSASPAPPPAPR